MRATCSLGLASSKLYRKEGGGRRVLMAKVVVVLAVAREWSAQDKKLTNGLGPPLVASINQSFMRLRSIYENCLGLVFVEASELG